MMKGLSGLDLKNMQLDKLLAKLIGYAKLEKMNMMIANSTMLSGRFHLSLVANMMPEEDLKKVLEMNSESTLASIRQGNPTIYRRLCEPDGRLWLDAQVNDLHSLTKRELRKMGK